MDEKGMVRSSSAEVMEGEKINFFVAKCRKANQNIQNITEGGSGQANRPRPDPASQ
jgi:hypothetical protein